MSEFAPPPHLLWLAIGKGSSFRLPPSSLPKRPCLTVPDARYGAATRSVTIGSLARFLMTSLTSAVANPTYQGMIESLI